MASAAGNKLVDEAIGKLTIGTVRGSPRRPVLRGGAMIRASAATCACAARKKMLQAVGRHCGERDLPKWLRAGD